MKWYDFRVELDGSDEKLSYRMRESSVKKIPYTLILGDKEKDSELISYRMLGSKETHTLDKNEFIKLVLDKIKNLKWILPFSVNKIWYFA